MKTILLEIINAALLAGLLQNLIFTGGFGFTESLRMAAKPNNVFRSTGFVALFSVSVTLICRSLDLLPQIKAAGRLLHALLFSAVLAAVYSAALGVTVLLRRSALTKRRLAVCALNSLVLSLPYIAYKSAFTFAETAGLALGAAAAYLIAAVLLKEGIEKLRENTSVPEAFKGNGALFVYAAVLSLAFSGITGTGITL